MPRRERTIALAISFTALLAALVVVFFAPVPYVRLSPGPVYNALGEAHGQSVVSVKGAESYPTDGTLGITTVYEAGSPGTQLTLAQAIRGWLSPSDEVISRDVLFPPDAFDGDDAGDNFRQQGVAQMAQSEQSAIAAALTYVGEPVSFDVVITQVQPDSPSSGVLEPDDVLVSIDGEPVDTFGDVSRTMKSVAPGDVVDLVVLRDDARLKESVTTGENPEDPERAYLGVLLGVGIDSPVEVDLRLDNVGGPSAGLIFTLAIVDTLTPEALADGRFIAGTGTMAPDGKIGPIGGIRQKMFGARDAGATTFLAPKANCDEVVGHIPAGLDVIAVGTLDQAVDALDGSGPTATCS